MCSIYIIKHSSTIIKIKSVIFVLIYITLSYFMRKILKHFSSSLFYILSSCRVSVLLVQCFGLTEIGGELHCNASLCTEVVLKFLLDLCQGFDRNAH